MTREMISQALESEGLKSTNQGYSLPEEREATVLIAAPGDVFPVARVVRIDLRDKFALLENAKKEHFFFAYEVILGMRMVGSTPTRERVAGFSR